MTPLTRRQMAWRAAQDIADGAVVNLGIGLPTAVADFIPAGREVILHSENGLLGMGPAPAPGHEDPDLINAGRGIVTVLPGASIFPHVDAFLMIRGGHLDLTIMGAFQVSATGDLANWNAETPAFPPGVGGAMDLASCTPEVRVILEHTTREGAPRIRTRCTLPLTAPACVKRIYTNLAIIDVTEGGLVVRESVAGLDHAGLQEKTEAPLARASDWRVLDAPSVT
jgi:3-oxoadipate CoA-transferase beta subunit